MSLSKNTKRIVWSVPTLSARCEKFPLSNLRNARNSLAPPGAEGTMIVSSDTLPRRAPTRPALSTGGGKIRSLRLELVKRIFRRFFP